MRIVIESNEREGAETPINESTQPANVETMDGGAPSQALIQAIAEALPISTEREGMDAGSPPEWLAEAIQGSTQPRTEGLNADTDAGSAPNEE
jgi:hypothetical protein